MKSDTIAKFKITALCLICGFSSMLCLSVLFDLLEILAQNVVLIIFVLTTVVNIAVSLGFFFVSRYSVSSDDVISVFNGTVLICTAGINLMCLSIIGIFIFQLLNYEYDRELLNSLQVGYGSPFHLRTTASWDAIQSNWKCCGLEDRREWQRSRWFLSQRTFPRINTPASCLNPLTTVPFDRGCLLEIRRHVLLIGIFSTTTTLICTYFQLKMAYRLFMRSYKYELQQDLESSSTSI